MTRPTYGIDGPGYSAYVPTGDTFDPPLPEINGTFGVVRLTYKPYVCRADLEAADERERAARCRLYRKLAARGLPLFDGV